MKQSWCYGVNRAHTNHQEKQWDSFHTQTSTMSALPWIWIKYSATTGYFLINIGKYSVVAQVTVLHVLCFATSGHIRASLEFWSNTEVALDEGSNSEVNISLNQIKFVSGLHEKHTHLYLQLMLKIWFTQALKTSCLRRNTVIWFGSFLPVGWNQVSGTDEEIIIYVGYFLL